MTKELATVLAQLIPVLAIGVGIEMRSLSKRYRRLAVLVLRPRESDQDRIEGDDYDLGKVAVALSIMALSLTQIILAIVEMRALGILTKDMATRTFLSPYATLTMLFAVAMVFCIPAYGAAMQVVLRNQKSMKQARGRRRVAYIAVLIAFFGLMYLGMGVAGFAL